MFLNKIGNIFMPRTQNFARANGETFVSATMCPQQCVLVCQGLQSHNLNQNSVGREFVPHTGHVFENSCPLKSFSFFFVYRSLSYSIRETKEFFFNDIISKNSTEETFSSSHSWFLIDLNSIQVLFSVLEIWKQLETIMDNTRHLLLKPVLIFFIIYYHL